MRNKKYARDLSEAPFHVARSGALWRKLAFSQPCLVCFIFFVKIVPDETARVLCVFRERAAVLFGAFQYKSSVLADVSIIIMSGGVQRSATFTEDEIRVSPTVTLKRMYLREKDGIDVLLAPDVAELNELTRAWFPADCQAPTFLDKNVLLRKLWWHRSCHEDHKGFSSV